MSRHAFDGWVTQPSPCCAGASVAGAANAALGLAHDDLAALSHAHVNALYHSMQVKLLTLIRMVLEIMPILMTITMA